MAIYHLNAQIVSRENGDSVVAGAAYRSGQNLFDERLGQRFDYTRKGGIAHAEILAPTGASDWVFDRQQLWNKVEAGERRKDAQLAREFNIALPVELSKPEQIALLRDYTQRAFVERGMVVDLALHLDNPQNPHAHFLVTMRGLTEIGFGPKRRDWNAKHVLMSWRSLWMDTTNEHLHQAGLDLRIDHRTLKAQGLDLVPGRKLGLSQARRTLEDLPEHLQDRVAEHQAIAAENGRRIIDTPTIALDAMTHLQSTFTERDLAKFLHGKTADAEQFEHARLKVLGAPELVALGTDDRGRARYTSQDLLETERTLLERAERLQQAHTHTVADRFQSQTLAPGAATRLSPEQRRAFTHLTAGTDLAVLIGVAGAGKSTLLHHTRQAWEAAGFTVRGASLAGIAAENLEHSSGIQARTLASWTHSWDQARDRLTDKTIFVIDEAGLVGTRQLARVLEAAEQAHAKVILVGDPEQLQAIEAGAPFRGIATQAQATGGMLELTEVRRQRHPWQSQATHHLATAHTGAALQAYRDAGHVHAHSTREAARTALLAAWAEAEPAGKSPSITPLPQSRLMLAYTREDVLALNLSARALRQRGTSTTLTTERGPREFAAGDRIMFLRNERSMAVKNGTLGTIESLRQGVLQVKLDGFDVGTPSDKAARRVIFDTRDYNHFDYGYATTVHKSQGSTVDRTFVLATPHFDRHATYVALSRHRETATLFYAEADFTSGWDRRTPAAVLTATLSRARPKALAHDFLEHTPGLTLDQRQQHAAERWRDKYRHKPALQPDQDLTLSTAHTPSLHPTLEHTRGGIEDDLDL